MFGVLRGANHIESLSKRGFLVVGLQTTPRYIAQNISGRYQQDLKTGKITRERISGKIDEAVLAQKQIMEAVRQGRAVGYINRPSPVLDEIIKVINWDKKSGEPTRESREVDAATERKADALNSEDREPNPSS
jgi:hypothetical protein